MTKALHGTLTGLVAMTLVFHTGCRHVDPLVTSGEAMDQLADTFVATADLMDHALESKAITEDQYRQWVVFGEKFQKTYPLAVDLWKVARLSGDPTLEADMLRTVNELAVQLLTFRVR